MRILVLRQDPKFRGPLGLVCGTSDLRGLVCFIAFHRPSVPVVHSTLRNIGETLRSLALALSIYEFFLDEDLDLDSMERSDSTEYLDVT